MPITEFSMGERPEQSYFHVGDEVEIYNRSLAHALNHIYNHLKILMEIAGSNVSVFPIQALTENHPVLRPLAQWVLENQERSAEGKFDSNTDLMLQEQITRVLQAELIELIVQTVHLAKIVDLGKFSKSDEIEADVHRLETLIASIPFVDYHYQNEPPPSIVRDGNQKGRGTTD